MIKIPSGVFQTDIENSIRERLQAVAAKHAHLAETAQKIGLVSTVDPNTTEIEIQCGNTTHHLSIEYRSVGVSRHSPEDPDTMLDAIEKLIPSAMSTLLMLLARLLRDGVQAGFFSDEKGNLHLNAPLSADAVKTGLAKMSNQVIGDTLIVPYGSLSAASEIAKDISQIRQVIELPCLYNDKGSWYIAAGSKGLVGATRSELELVVSNNPFSWELLSHVAVDYGDSTAISRFDIC